MDSPPRRSAPVENDEESPEFLCTVAAESVNDAILFLAGSQCAAEPLLRQALAILIERASADGAQAVAGQPTADDDPPVKPRLSSHAIDLLVAERLREAEAESCAASRKGLGKRLRSHPAALEPKRQRAVMLMIEAMSLLDQLDDLEALTHLQLAVDHALDSCPPERSLPIDGAEKPRPN